MGQRRLRRAAWAFLLCLLVGGTALAQPPPATPPAQAAPTEADIARARSHFQAGQEYFEELRYDDAAREFTEAWEISRRPEMLFNVSIAYERGLHFDEAIAAVEQYLPLATESERPAAQRRLDRLRELRERHRAQQAGGTTGPEPEPDDVQPVEIGERPSEATSDGGSSTGGVDRDRGGRGGRHRRAAHRAHRARDVLGHRSGVPLAPRV